MTTTTESPLQIAAALNEAANNVRSAIHLGEAAKLMELAAGVIVRLAAIEAEHEIQAQRGEN